MKKIELTKERRDRLVCEIRAYLADNHDDDVGDLKATLLLDFFLERLGPQIYNQAIRNAQTFFQDKVIDLEIELMQPERKRKSDER